MKRSVLYVVVILLPFSVNVATGSYISYTDRTAWRIAAGGGSGNLTENFEGFAGDTSYETVPVVAGFMTVSNQGSGSSVAAIVDVPPFQNPLTDVNGTSLLRLMSNTAAGTHWRVDFSEPVKAVGFDVNGQFNKTMHMFDSSEDAVTVPFTSTGGFFGLVYDPGSFTQYLRANTTGVPPYAPGTDNWEAYSVPEPSTLIIWATLGTLGIICGWRRRRR